MEKTSNSDTEPDRCLTPTQPESATSEAMPRRIGDLLSRLPSPLPDEELRRRDLEMSNRQRDLEHRERLARWRSLVSVRGSRYENCRLANFEADLPEQRAVVESLEDYCRNMRELVRENASVVLYGPKGTGKDHLLAALMRAASLRFGLAVEWVNGMDLYGDWRDGIDRGASEREAVAKLGSPEVLAISDPLPPIGRLSEWQASMLFRVLDYRYSRERPVWVTVNVASRQELDERMGAQLADRIVDGALACFCNWPSYRKRRE